MPLLNSAQGYGSLTKLLHWGIVILFGAQYFTAAVMLRTPADGALLGMAQSTSYNWHKSLGLVALLLTVLRLLNRRAGSLPPWAPTLSPLEQALVHRAEQLLYAAMLIMPLSGLVYVMAGGYGVLLFGALALPNPFATPLPALAALARWVHVASAVLLLLPLGAHLAIVLGHHFILRDGLISRMLNARTRADR